MVPSPLPHRKGANLMILPLSLWNSLGIASLFQAIFICQRLLQRTDLKGLANFQSFIEAVTNGNLWHTND